MFIINAAGMTDFNGFLSYSNVHGSLNVMVHAYGPPN